MSLYAIGDVHGCVRTLEGLIEQLDPTTDDHLVFIGDYVDRGPDSRGVIEYLIGLRDRFRCTFLRGNHEAMMLNYINHNELELWHINGGDTTIASYTNNGRLEIPEGHIEFIRDTISYHDEPDFFFVHAGLKPDLTILENLQRFGSEVFLWERSHLAAANIAWEKPVVCGHTPQREPISTDHLICIDTGCVYLSYPGYGTLTAVQLPERKMIRIPNREF